MYLGKIMLNWYKTLRKSHFRIKVKSKKPNHEWAENQCAFYQSGENDYARLRLQHQNNVLEISATANDLIENATERHKK